MSLHSSVFRVAVLACGLGAFGCNDGGTAIVRPNSITYEPPHEGRYSENFDYDEIREQFVVGSAFGQLGLVDWDGTYTMLANDTPEGMTDIWGITVDEARDRLLALYVAPAQPDKTVLGVFTLSTATLERFVDLDPAALTDGRATRSVGEVIEVLSDGTLLISDGFAPVVFRVGPDYAVDLFLDRPELGPQQPFVDMQPSFGSGPLELLGDRVFIVAANDEGGKIFVTSLDAPEADFREVPITGALPAVADGNQFISETEWAITGNNVREVRVVVTDDDWQTARLDTSRVFSIDDGFPTELREVEGDLYLINGYLNVNLMLFFSGMERPVAGMERETFVISRVEF